jgi:hypothetical protein
MAEEAVVVYLKELANMMTIASQLKSRAELIKSTFTLNRFLVHPSTSLTKPGIASPFYLAKSVILFPTTCHVSTDSTNVTYTRCSLYFYILSILGFHGG